MLGRRRLVAILVLAAVLHALGIARTILPAQDGLKFIRVARQFQTTAPAEVIRASDQHPLYPALVALVQPVIAAVAGPGSDAWRIAAQMVAALASIAVLIPLYGLARSLFDDRIAALAALLYAVLPLPLNVGHDTLSDTLALLATLTALRLGVTALATARPSAFVACGLVAGLGYLARPEVALVPLAATIAMAFGRDGRRPEVLHRAGLRFATLAVAFLTVVGSYTLVKGEVSEKLALRHGVGLAKQPKRSTVRKLPRQWLPPGLDDPRWDFSPKEEATAEDAHEKQQSGIGAGHATVQIVTRWAEGLGGFLGLFALWGALRARSVRRIIALRACAGNTGKGDGHLEGSEPVPSPSDAGGGPPVGSRLLLTAYLIVFALALIRHVTVLGYLSDRHVLPLVAVSLPWTAAGLCVCFAGMAGRLGWSTSRARVAGMGLLFLGTVTAIVVSQAKPSHTSRWGHRAAGDWLRRHAGPGEAVLDTRGWASFVADRPAYDYWHVRQALTDAHLAYVVVGTDELTASSRRAETLRAVLAFAASPIAGFPDEQGGQGIGVQVYRFRHPDSWEGLIP